MPIIFLNVKHGTNITLFLLFIGAINFFARMNRISLLRKSLTESHVFFLFVLLSPTLAIAISQAIRYDFYSNNWDSPIRMLLCIPVFLAISEGWLLSGDKENITQFWIKWSIPTALFAALITRIYFPGTNWAGYKSTYFVDPLSFCSFTLLFAMLTIIGGVHYHKEVNWIHKLFFAASIFIGLYLSITSGARTGWLNLPVFIIILYTYSLTRYSKKHRFLFILLLLVGLAALFFINTQFVNKFYVGLQELSSYKINDLNGDTSIGMRLSFYRMGTEYFFERPLAGWGDLAWVERAARPEFMIFASNETIFAAKHGFHNEIITNSVRSGIWGLISVISLYVVVTYKALNGLRTKLEARHRLASVCMLITILHIFFAGLVTETTNLTFLSAFIGIFLTVFYGEQLFLEKNPCKLQ